MKRFILYADWKHDDPEEYLNIYLDTELNDLSKDVLYDYVCNYLNKTFDLTYVDTGDVFKLSEREFYHMLDKEEYHVGDIDNTYLYPTSITVKIVEDKSISLKGLLTLY